MLRGALLHAVMLLVVAVLKNTHAAPMLHLLLLLLLLLVPELCHVLFRMSCVPKDDWVHCILYLMLLADGVLCDTLAVSCCAVLCCAGWT
jgi:hypothetical protein